VTRGRIERFGSLALFGSLGVVLFTVSAAQVLFGIAALVWLYLVLTDRDRVGPRLPPFFWALALYAGLTVVSAFLVGAEHEHEGLALERAKSLVDLKQLVLFLMVPIVMRLARGDRATKALDVIIAMGGAGAVYGVVQAMAVFGFGNMDQRPEGTLTHYMTYSGVIMLVLCAAAARLLFHSGQWIWPAVAVPALSLALVTTFTRNAWIGAMAGIGCLLAVRRAKLLLLLPVAVALALAIGPVRERTMKTFDLSDGSNRDRVQMWGIGRRIVADHPLFGVGPNQVETVYPLYRPPDSVRPVNVHLHNVYIQIAAERGLLALAAWLTFIALAVVGLVRQVRRGPARALAGAGLASIVAMLAAGLFEHNFGDSEVLMLFLGLITLPWAGSAGSAGSVGRA
jgi:O-antigen ligase